MLVAFVKSRKVTMQETETFIYCRDDLLGQGATSLVYKGISKKDGSYCALKVFKNKHDFSWKLFQRELDALSKIKHENIVQILGTETDEYTGTPILVMEFLNRGTLYDQLQEPENLNGFSDHMFLSLLKDLVAGLNQLQIAGIVHRDIKPSNILRSIESEGRNIYKLSDFGTAKMISNEDVMESLVGTEEYVHPNMYEKVFINGGVKLKSLKHLDEWSLGVTLYHVATGNVPFQTKEGARKNRKCRFEMLKLKPSGVISARIDENGEITWEKELPSTCVLSRSLSKLISKSISCLLETNPKKAWSIEEFLKDMETMLKMIPVHVMQPSQERIEIFYLNPQDTVPHLKEAIAQEWDVPGDEQLLFHGCIDLTSPFETKTISKYPQTRLRNPVILIEKNLMEDIRIPSLSIETISFPKETSSSSTDSLIATRICSQIYQMKQVFHHHSHVNDSMIYTVGILNSMVGSEIRNTQLLICNFGNLIWREKYKFTLESVNNFEEFVGYPDIGKRYKKIKNLFKEAGEILKHIKSNDFKTKHIYFKVTERNYLKAIFETVKADFEEHKEQFTKVREDFQRWLSKKLEALQKISRMKRKLIQHPTYGKIHSNVEMNKKLRQQTKDLIEISRKEAHRLSDLNSDFFQFVSSSMCYT